ncbi:dynein regulatory complex subunit 3 isoform X2 [Andrographis paniculata]|uniref:dynein regulatory complex subunit 3 isoform X2 n=1 Tax=Andrographis paniculata TaxID=175694 RepID=UPI0021E80ACF|nr:dynein regulatory complex subunit 3 isoform X2 [Andrographis paniculata]
MAVLSSRKILQEKNANDPSSITSLTLTHRALSDVSCLSEFTNLERLDLSFNSLTSLEGLKSCVNLKWLSVVQNKLQSLRGIEGLTKLTVLNAGKNKLKSMDEVKSLSSLRALILNENEISSVCKLDQMKELNTLGRNPIRSLGESFIQVKSITKLSLSNCQLQSIDSSLKSCTQLKELRLAHNEIKTISSEIGHLVKLQNLDLGNNSITSWSSLKVLTSLINLRNFNLKGNPVAEKENVLKKVKKLLPNLHIFNAKPINKISAKEVPEKDDEFSLDTSDKLALKSDMEMDPPFRIKSSEETHRLDESTDNRITNVVDMRKRKKSLDEWTANSAVDAYVTEKRLKKKMKLQQNKGGVTNDAETLNANLKEEMKSKQKKQKEHGSIKTLGSVVTDDKPGKKSGKDFKGDEAIDSAEIPFTDLFKAGVSMEVSDQVSEHKIKGNIDAISGLVTHPKKKKKTKSRAINPASLEQPLADEIGLGGPSAWDDA